MVQIWLPAIHELFMQALGKIAYERREMESGPHPTASSATNQERPLLATILVHMSPGDKKWPL